MNIFKNTKKEDGFTLIEVMASVGLFTVVMIISITAILKVNNTYRKARTMRSAIDNLSFVMEDMARNIRLGKNYKCVNDQVDYTLNIETPADSPADTSCLGIAFEPFYNPVVGDEGDEIIYLLDESNKSIFKATDGPSATFHPMNSVDLEINVLNSGFTIYGSAPDDNEQPSVLIRLNGTVSSSGSTTDFNLQTTVTQRFLDLP